MRICLYGAASPTIDPAYMEAHRSGKGAKYTRGRSPLELVYREACEDHSHALKREREIKAMPREQKLRFIGCADPTKQ